MINAQTDINDLIRFYFSLKKEKETWSDYMGVHFKFADNGTDLAKNAAMIMETYLQGIPCRAYLASKTDLYFIFRSHDVGFFAQATENIETYCAWEKQYCEGTWYDFDRQLDDFLRHIENVYLQDILIDPASPTKDIHTNVTTSMTGTVLLVEDDPVTRWMVRHALRPHCFLITATCAGHVYKLYQSCKPDVVFLDIGLPDASGRDVLKWIIHHDPAANIIMFSGHNDIDTMMSTIEEGAKGFITKPYHPDKLHHYLNTFSIHKSEV